MDPFKVLNIAPVALKHPSDLNPARRRARTLYKRYTKEKNKFDARKVLEAFDMLQAKLKNKPGEGSYKILGRSRMERMMDKHYNHQTKEIKKNKPLIRALRRARKGDKRLLLPGEKERVPRHRRASRRARRRKHRAKLAKRAGVDVLQGLQRLTGVLRDQTKFPKAVKLLHRWMKEYMNADNREFVFEVLQEIVGADFLLEDKDARQDVVEVFSYLFGYYSDWFQESDRTRAMLRCWQVATVLSCQCYTDDAFTLAATISKLREALTLLDEHRGILADHDKVGERELSGRTPGRSPSDFGTDDEADSDVDAKTEPKSELKDDVKEELDLCKKDVKDELDLLVKEEEKLDRKWAMPAQLPDDVIKSERRPAKRGVKRKAVEIDLDADGPIDLDDAEDDVKIEIETDGDDDDWCSEISSMSSVSSVSISDEEFDGIELDDCIFPVPTIQESVEQLRRHFVSRCLAALFQQRGPLWAKPKIDPLFQDVFYKRCLLTVQQRAQVEGWQARIKMLQKTAGRDVGEANNPLEAHRPVVDSRETRVSLDSDTNAWAAKQTFDSRDAHLGSKTLR